MTAHWRTGGRYWRTHHLATVAIATSFNMTDEGTIRAPPRDSNTYTGLGERGRPGRQISAIRPSAGRGPVVCWSRGLSVRPSAGAAGPLIVAAVRRSGDSVEIVEVDCIGALYL